MSITDVYDELRSAASLTTDRAVIRVRTTYQPAAGPGSRVYPPTFPTTDGHPYIVEPRWSEAGKREAVVLDQTPSQANRAEEALLRAARAGRIKLPLLEIQHAGAVETILSSLELPHRFADAYLRDAEIDGVRFDKTLIGEAFAKASLDDASSLFTYDPGSLVFGAWNSHRKGRQAKFPRAYASEIVGWDPAFGGRRAGRMDPVNLSGAARPEPDGWSFSATAQKVKGEKLSEIGHGNIAPNPAHGGVTISGAERQATVSLAALDRIGFGSVSSDAAVAARTALAAYALLGDRLAFAGASLWLRSGCELVVESDTLEWVNRGGGVDALPLTTDDAISLFAHSTEVAAKAGLAMSTDVVALRPMKALADAIDYALTRAEPSDA